LMCVPVLPAVLAERTGALLVPVETQPLEDGRCRVIAHAPIDVPEFSSVPDICQRCWLSLEPIIHSRPHEYLWAYKHFRYRPKNAKRPYPPYSNESGKFEKLRSQAEGGREPTPR
jgi:Kdo2-lipid IVA lauroyltransferase/acyltransferase